MSTTGVHTVRQGDTLYKIAKQNNTTVQNLMQLNGISDPKKLQIGTILKLKGGSSDTVGEVNTGKVTIPEGVDGTLSDATQIKNDNMRNLKTGFNDLMSKLDEFELPEGVTREKFRELIEGGYKYHIVENDFPSEPTDASGFVYDLLMNALSDSGNSETMKPAVLKFAAEMYPDGDISKYMAQVKQNNTENLNLAYNNITENFDNIDFPENIDKAKLKAGLEASLNDEKTTMPADGTREEEFAYSLLQNAFNLTETDETAQRSAAKDLLTIAAQMYPGGEIGGVSCDIIATGKFNIVNNQIIPDAE